MGGRKGDSENGILEGAVSEVGDRMFGRKGDSVNECLDGVG